MSLASDIQTILAADAALIAIFGNLIITYEQLGDLGLNRVGFPSAFDSAGELLPILVVRDRNANATSAMRGESEQIESYVQAAEIVCYCSRVNNTNDTILDTALARVYTLLQDKNAGSTRMMQRQRVNGQREPLLNYAWMGWAIWDAMGLFKP